MTMTPRFSGPIALAATALIGSLGSTALAGPPVVCGDPTAGDCWSANGTPGCDHADCCAIVCAIEPWCCDVEWDSYCAGLAADNCGSGQLGACCLADQSCLQATFLDCQAMGGYYKGDLLACSEVDCAVVPIYETDDPFGGFLGLWGPDVGEHQSVAVRITPDQDYTLESISVWLMNNNFDGTYFGEVTLSIRDDDDTLGYSAPHADALESWTFTISAVGWDPQLETVESTLHPLLTGGLNYWIVAESDAPVFDNPVWPVASPGNGYSSVTHHLTGQWQQGGDGAVPATLVYGKAVPNPADLTGDGTVNVFDLLDLLGAWGECADVNDCPADLTGDDTVNVFDLLELLGAWG